MRSSVAGALPVRTGSYDLALVVIARGGRGLDVLLPALGRGQGLPTGAPDNGERLDVCARRLVRTHARTDATWIEPLGAFDDAPSEGSDLTIGYVAVVATQVAVNAGWVPLDRARRRLTGRSHAVLEAAIHALRTRMDHAPIAFRLLPERFTLAELQAVHEWLLERPVHKASFRRTLQAARLVEPIEEWRVEGPGRPAQLYRYAPRRTGTLQRGLRFDAQPRRIRNEF